MSRLFWSLCLLLFTLATGGCQISDHNYQLTSVKTPLFQESAISHTPTAPKEIESTVSRTVPAPATLTPQLTSTPKVVSVSTSSIPNTEPNTNLIAHTLIAPTRPSTTSKSMDLPCDQRNPGDDLLTLVTHDYGLSRDFRPSDLVNLNEYFPVEITLGYSSQLREVAVGSLREMLDEMIAEGLRPRIISAFRDYSAQVLAWNKWVENEPERASIISAPPGHSEHQLGTTIDFGSPELDNIVGQEGIEFHTYFYKTSESQWLETNAHRFGFVLSFPLEAMEYTGFYYEPWHYRYVGSELATSLKNQGKYLIQFLLETESAPCIP